MSRHPECMDVVICHQSIVPYDAIGNDIAEMHRLLQSRFAAAVYGNFVSFPGVDPVDAGTLDALIARPENLLIYHHSIYWAEGEEILRRAKARIVVRYHNITPQSFFEAYDDTLYALCRQGREQTMRLKMLLPDALWMADSAHNLREAGLESLARTVVVPPFHAIERWGRTVPDEPVLRGLVESDRLNLLFVGRLVPSKEVGLLIRSVADHAIAYGRPLCLHVVGAPLAEGDAYHREMQRLVEWLGLEDRVHLVGRVDDPTLLAYYLGSDYFVCASAHEGFCVPLVEAQALRLPIIARDVPAVRETLGGDQLCLGAAPEEYSAAIETLVRNPHYRRWLIERGLENFERRFALPRIAERFWRALDAVIAEAA